MSAVAYTCDRAFRYMLAGQLVERLQAMGIRAWVVEPETLRLACKKGALPPLLERQLQESKPWLVELLRERKAN